MAARSIGRPISKVFPSAQSPEAAELFNKTPSPVLRAEYTEYRKNTSQYFFLYWKTVKKDGAVNNAQFVPLTYLPHFYKDVTAEDAKRYAELALDKVPVGEDGVPLFDHRMITRWKKYGVGAVNLLPVGRTKSAHSADHSGPSSSEASSYASMAAENIDSNSVFKPKKVKFFSHQISLIFFSKKGHDFEYCVHQIQSFGSRKSSHLSATSET